MHGGGLGGESVRRAIKEGRRGTLVWAVFLVPAAAPVAVVGVPVVVFVVVIVVLSVFA